MPTWTWRYDATSLQIDGPVVHATAAAPGAEARPIRALLDTGAGTTLLAPSLVRDLGLVAIAGLGASISRAGGPARPSGIYEVALTFPGTSLPSMTTRAGEHGDLDNEPLFRIVVGREVLRACVLIYNGPKGDVTLAI